LTSERKPHGRSEMTEKELQFVGAREIVEQYFDEFSCPNDVDHFLAWLWVEGFKVVRHDD
jgi:hypothetical protein